MLQRLQGSGHAAIPIHRKSVQPTNDCSDDLFGRVCREIWAEKAAAKLASRAGTTVRAAEYWIAGKRKPSAAAAAAIVSEIFGHH